MRDAEFLRWIANRLVNVHNENPNVDFVHKLHAIADALPQEQSTPNIIRELR